MNATMHALGSAAAKHAVVIGGGLAGLSAAEALAGNGGPDARELLIASALGDRAQITGAHHASASPRGG